MQQKNAGGDVEKYIPPLTKNISYTQYTKKILPKYCISVFNYSNHGTWSLRNIILRGIRHIKYRFFSSALNIANQLKSSLTYRLLKHKEVAAASTVLFSYSVLHTGESKSHHRLEWSYANDLSGIRSWTSGDNLFGYGTATFDLKARDTHEEDRLQSFGKFSRNH